jgi:hypothetical protein
MRAILDLGFWILDLPILDLEFWILELDQFYLIPDL